MNTKARPSEIEDTQMAFDFWHDSEVHYPICKDVRIGLNASDKGEIDPYVATSKHHHLLGQSLYAFICGAGTALNILPIGGEVPFCTSDAKALDSDWRLAAIDFNDVFLTAAKTYGAGDNHERWSAGGGYDFRRRARAG